MTTARRVLLRFGVVPVTLISLEAGLGSVVPAQAAAQAPAAYSLSGGSASISTAYVANIGSGTVTPITTATNTAGPPISVGSGPVVIAITPDGKTAYVGNSSSNTVTPISTATNTAGAPIPVENDPYNIAITPDGKTAYVVNGNSNTVTPIATATNTTEKPILTGRYPDAIVITPDGRTAYVSNVTSGTVTPIATATNTTNTAGAPIPVGSLPYNIAITPDGKTAYITNGGSDTVTPIATATNTAGAAIPTGSEPYAIAITPATAPQGPAFTSDPSDTVTFGSAFTFTVTTNGSPPPRITKAGRLPAGVTFTRHNDGTATIAGTPRPRVAGVYPLTLTAKNKYGTATQSFTLTVTRAPFIKKIHTIGAREGI